MMQMRSWSAQRGMTLIELMIAGVLSLIITYFVMNILISNNRSSNLSEGISQAQETGRFTLTWLSKQIRRAGYDTIIGTANSVAAVAPLCTNAQSISDPCTFQSNVGAGDNIAIQRRYSSNAALPATDRQACDGTDLSGNAAVTNGSILTDVFWVNDSGVGSLRCATYVENVAVPVSNGQQTIASGIESMHVLFGIRQTPLAPANANDNYINNYVAANNVTDWSQVIAVRVAILTRSFSDNALDQKTRSYVLLDSDAITAQDQIARHIQTTTLILPNVAK